MKPRWQRRKKYADALFELAKQAAAAVNRRLRSMDDRKHCARIPTTPTPRRVLGYVDATANG